MKLHYKVAGAGTPLLILHGLFGNLENWRAQIKVLSEQFRVYAVDLRNHGRSPWDARMDYGAISDDLLEFLDDHGLEQILLLGHSMGGKAAMQLALEHPERVEKLIVVDIAPVSYPPGHNEVFEGLFKVALDRIQSRADADRALAEHVEELGVRQFLLTNLYRDGHKFAWRMNLDGLHKAYESIAAAPDSRGHYPRPTLFIKGAESNYIQEKHRDEILRRFPQVKAKVMDGCGHWPHAEKPALFSKQVLRFLQQP